MTPAFKNQMLEAAGWTFLETFLVTVGPAIAVVNVGDWGALAGIAGTAVLAAAAAVVSLVKSYIVRDIGGTDSTLISAPSPEACAIEATTTDGAVG